MAECCSLALPVKPSLLVFRAAALHSCMDVNHAAVTEAEAGPGICSPGFHAIPPGGGGGGLGPNTPVTMPLDADRAERGFAQMHMVCVHVCMLGRAEGQGHGE